jgi:TetR/AcrR family transcriptional repressor of nem operon
MVNRRKINRACKSVGEHPHEFGEVTMRYAPEHNEATRERILEAASRLFRQHGIAAVGLARIMAEADLTVGTFYTHFKSKEGLLREALARALQARHQELEQVVHGGDFEMAVRAYLSPEHRDATGTGCPVAALAAEVARHPRPTRDTFMSGNEPTLDAVAAGLSSRRGKEVDRAEAAAFLGLLAGTLQLARATPDRAESEAILEAGIRAALRLAK